jgi:opacity protein-like surface antigen
MKKTLLLLSFLAVAGMASAPVQAANRYVSGMAGISWMQDMTGNLTYQNSETNEQVKVDLGSGLTLAAATGCDFGNYRLEAELGYQNNDINSLIRTNGKESTRPYALKGDLSVTSLMGNGYYDIDLGGAELYGMAGVGVARVALHDAEIAGSPNPGYSFSETTLAWQIGTGLAVPVAKNVKMDLRYRYFATTDFTINEFGGYNTNVSSQSVLLGLRVAL